MRPEQLVGPEQDEEERDVIFSAGAHVTLFSAVASVRPRQETIAQPFYSAAPSTFDET